MEETRNWLKGKQRGVLGIGCDMDGFGGASPEKRKIVFPLPSPCRPCSCPLLHGSHALGRGATWRPGWQPRIVSHKIWACSAHRPTGKEGRTTLMDIDAMEAVAGIPSLDTHNTELEVVRRGAVCHEPLYSLIPRPLAHDQHGYGARLLLPTTLLSSTLSPPSLYQEDLHI